MPLPHAPGAGQRTRAAQRRLTGGAQVEAALARRHDALGDVATGVDALAEAAGWRAQALLVGGTPAYAQRAHIANFALRRRWPCVSTDIDLVDAGALLAYGPSPADGPMLLAHLAAMADRTLRGANPADMPVEQPSRYDLAVNLKTAQALGPTIPQSVRLRADRVIE